MGIPSLRFIWVFILGLAFLLIPQPGSAQFYCLMCDDYLDYVNMEAGHRFDSSGWEFRECHDGDCHNNWRDGHCLNSHNDCNETRVREIQEAVDELFLIQDLPILSTELAILAARTRLLSVSDDGAELRLHSCAGHQVQAWATDLEGLPPRDPASSYRRDPGR